VCKVIFFAIKNFVASFSDKFHNMSSDSNDFFPLRHNTGPVLEVLTKEFSLVADRSSLGGGERDNVMEIKTKVS
jgi:hypothetical protein